MTIGEKALFETALEGENLSWEEPMLESGDFPETEAMSCWLSVREAFLKGGFQDIVSCTVGHRKTGLLSQEFNLAVCCFF